jgi:hypothetical protein
LISLIEDVSADFDFVRTMNGTTDAKDGRKAPPGVIIPPTEIRGIFI